MKNKRGFTMVELMVSIAIIAVFMVFLVRLLIDVKYDSTNELYNTDNQINRAEIIKTIQEDWLDKELYNLKYSGGIIELYENATDKAEISFSGTRKDGQYIHYKDTDGKKYKWKVERNNKETYIETDEIPYKIIKNINDENEEITNDYFVEINIPIIIDNSDLRKNNDSKMDNIVLTFYGSNECIIPNNQFLEDN